MNKQRLVVPAWCLYDWANSAFTTLVVTFVYATYFTKAFSADTNTGTAWWSRGVALSAVIIALSSPILGALADRGGKRRRFLLIATVLCVVSTAGLAFVVPGSKGALFFALTLFVIGNVAFEIGMVFYNALLPEVAPAARIGRVSGYGWALGYAGGLVCLVIALFGFVGLGDAAPWFRLSTVDGWNVRATNLLVAGWFALFCIPLLWLIRDQKTGHRTGFARAFNDLGSTLISIRNYPDIVRLLLARLVYNDGLVTVFAFGGIYAAGTFGMEFGEVIVFGIALNVTAGLGAWLFGFLDDRAGGRPTILLSLVALSVASLAAVLAPDQKLFWAAGLAIGIFAGPNQAASRSLMARFVPYDKQNEFFGFFAFSGKATAFLGPLLLGLLTQRWGQRVGVSSVLVFFLLGALLLLAVNEDRGKKRAAAENAGLGPTTTPSAG